MASTPQQLQHELRVASQLQQDALQGLAEWLTSPPPPTTSTILVPRKTLPPTRMPPAGTNAEGSAREAGNVAFAAGAFADAIVEYTKSLSDQCTVERSLAYSNRAMARLKLSQWVGAEDDATEALRLNPTHVKSWQRRATARRALGLVRAALTDLEVAAALKLGNGGSPAGGAAQLLFGVRTDVEACRRRAPQAELVVANE